MRDVGKSHFHSRIEVSSPVIRLKQPACLLIY